MSSIRIFSRRLPILRFQPILPRYQFYATKASNPDPSEPLGEGVVGKGDPKARPVILEHSAPSDPKDPDVKKHNEEFEKRAERAAHAEGKDREDGEKVEKGFWKGQGGVDRQP